MRFFSHHRPELIRGALLHDYFLYDWHLPDKSRPLHGFYHPKAACKNAEKDFSLTEIERDIIKKHMFPLTLSLPAFRESLLVCLVDKYCSLREIMRKSGYKNAEMLTAYKIITSKENRK